LLALVFLGGATAGGWVLWNNHRDIFKWNEGVVDTSSKSTGKEAATAKQQPAEKTASSADASPVENKTSTNAKPSEIVRADDRPKSDKTPKPPEPTHVALITGTRKPEDLDSGSWGTREDSARETSKTKPGRDENSTKNKEPTAEDSTRGELQRARARASDLYQSRDFSGAASLLRRAAANLDRRQANRLKELARKYDNVAQQVSRGDQMRSDNQKASLQAYRNARDADVSLGAAHQSYLNARIRLVAPEAARQYMVDGNYEEARRAADLAPTAKVGSVYRALEAEAQSLYRDAAEIAHNSDDASRKKARVLLKKVRKMVKSGSALDRQAATLLDRVAR
jgi:hypothetical protein